MSNSKRKKKAGFFENRVVVQKNDFLRGNTKYFTINDLKFLKLLISKIHLQDRKKTLFSEYYEVTAEEIKHLNINEKHLRQEVIKILTKLASIYVTIDSAEGERIVGLIKNDFFFPRFQKKVRVAFNQDMEQYLLVSNNYTKYLLSDIIDFKYKHTLKLYEYIKSIDLNIIKIEYSKLRKILELTDLYNRDTDFKKVIINSVGEINTKAASIKIEASFEKKNSFYFVDFIISTFDVINNKKFNEIGVTEIGYRKLLEQECTVNKKKFIVENIISNNEKKEYSIELKEKNSVRTKEYEFESQVGLIEKLKILFVDKFIINSLEDISPIEKDFRNKDLTAFKKDIIDKYRGAFLINNAPGFQEDQKLYLNNDGLIIKEDGIIIDKEKAFAVWEYTYANKEKIGVYEDVEPIKIFMGEILERHIKNPLFGTNDIIKYKVDDIKKEGLNYRLYLKDEAGSIETAKNTLNYKQLVTLMDKKVI